MSVTVVARATGISQSSCFNILRTLAREHFVHFDAQAKTYTFGLGLIELACQVLSRNRTVVIRPQLEDIAQRYEALVTLWDIVDGKRMVLIDRVVADTAIRIELRLGLRLPAFAGAIGRCVAAALNLPPDELSVEFERLTWQSPVSLEVYAKDVEQARTDGYAIDRGYWARGVTVVGTAVHDREGRPRMGIGALTLSGRLSLAELRSLGEALHATSAAVGKIW